LHRLAVIKHAVHFYLCKKIQKCGERKKISVVVTTPRESHDEENCEEETRSFVTQAKKQQLDQRYVAIGDL